MQIYCFIFAIIVKKESQVFFNIYRCLERINLLFQTLSRLFFPAWLIIRERERERVTFRLEFMIIWEAFCEVPSDEIVFFKTNQVARVNDFAPSMGGQCLLDWSEFLFHLSAALVPWQRSLKVFGSMLEYSKLIQSELGEEHIPVSLLGTFLKSNWNGESHMETHFPILYHSRTVPLLYGSWCQVRYLGRW